MKRTLLAIALAFAFGLSASAQTTKVVTDSVTFMPAKVQIFKGVTSGGNPKYWIELAGVDGKIQKVSMTESHVKSDRLLALIERRDTTTGKYSYSIKFAEPRKYVQSSGKADLSSLK